MLGFSFERRFPVTAQRSRHRFVSTIVATLLVLCGHGALARAGSVALVRNWTVSNPNFTNTQMNGMFSATDVPNGSTTSIPLQVSMLFNDFTPQSFTFTNSFTKADYTAAPNNGSLSASINAYSRFSANFTLDNATGLPWSGFIFNINDNVPGRTLDGTDTHPDAAHFHANTTSAFATTLAPFTNLTRIPQPSDTARFNGFSTALVSGGTLPAGDLWSPQGLGLHNNISFDANDNNQTSFTLTLDPIAVPEPVSIMLASFGGLLLCSFRLTRWGKRKKRG
jgi:hypothetical protein